MKRMITVMSSWLVLLMLCLNAAGQGMESQAKKASVPATDAEIKKCIEERFAKSSSLSGQAINVAVSSAEATLTGTVKAGIQKGTATRIARGKACGAKNVTNNLTVEAATGPTVGKKTAVGRP